MNTTDRLYTLVRRTWRERLFTRPWQPLKRLRRVELCMEDLARTLTSGTRERALLMRSEPMPGTVYREDQPGKPIMVAGFFNPSPPPDLFELFDRRPGVPKPAPWPPAPPAPMPRKSPSLYAPGRPRDDDEPIPPPYRWPHIEPDAGDYPPPPPRHYSAPDAFPIAEAVNQPFRSSGFGDFAGGGASGSWSEPSSCSPSTDTGSTSCSAD